MTIYYIRSKRDPTQFIKGTPTYHKWQKTGRSFTLGTLRSFITAVLKNEYYRKFIGDWEIVESEIQITNIKELHDIVKPEKIMELLKK